MSASPAVIASGIVRRFGFQMALDRVDLEAGDGETVLLLGANGAGKTTLLRILAGLLSPNEGKVAVRGGSPHANEAGARRRIGFLSHNLALYPDLTAFENLRFFARLYDVANGATRAADLLAEAGLAAWRDEPIRGFSRGMKQRLALARVFLHEPDVLLLDEPFTGLDLVSARALAERLRAARKAGAAVVLTSHQIEIAAPLGDRALVLRRGRLQERIDLSALDADGRTARVEETLRVNA